MTGETLSKEDGGHRTLTITEQTVKNYLHNIFDKLNVRDRLELALCAVSTRIHL